MSEQQKTYEKTIKYTDALRDLCAVAERKMLENAHKSDPVLDTIAERSRGVFREYDEFDDALDLYMSDPSEKNYDAMEKEAGDVINELLFTCLNAKGYTKMERV